MKTYNCLNCGKESKWTHQKKNKFCSMPCQQEYRFSTDTLPRFKRGEIVERSTIRNILRETDEYQCDECGIGDTYNNKPITLQVDHIDGNAGNNLPVNLRLLCPNCHTQQDNWGARNKGYGRKARGLSLR